MGIEDLAKQAGDFAKDNADKIQEALKSEQAEGISDKVLDGAADLAKSSQAASSPTRSTAPATQQTEQLATSKTA